MKSPCHECTDRVAIPNCHATCEKYKQYAAWCESVRLKKHIANMAKGASISQAQKRVNRYLRDKRK